MREALESPWKAFQWIYGENNLLSQKTLTLFDTFGTIPHSDHRHPHIPRSPWNALKALNALKAPSLSQLQYCYLTLGSIPGWIGFPWKAENPYLVQINQPFRLNKKVAVVRWPGGYLAKVVNCLSSNSPSEEKTWDPDPTLKPPYIALLTTVSFPLMKISVYRKLEMSFILKQIWLSCVIVPLPPITPFKTCFFPYLLQLKRFYH